MSKISIFFPTEYQSILQRICDVPGARQRYQDEFYVIETD